MKLVLNVWRQSGPDQVGKFVRYTVAEASEHMSFLELLDVLNEQLMEAGDEPVAFEHDCREGICGSCGMMINGVPHGPQKATATCQLHCRTFQAGDELWVEPFRAAAFPVVKDLIIDRSPLDRIIQAGGFISASTGRAPEAGIVLVPKHNADLAMDAAACIGCGACVAACPNASAMLFVSAKVSHFALLAQGQTERRERVQAMLNQMDAEGFGHCTNHGACSVACPKSISQDFIAQLNRDMLSSLIPR